MGLALVGCSGRCMSAPGSTLLVPSPLHTLQSSRTFFLLLARLLPSSWPLRRREEACTPFEPFCLFFLWRGWKRGKRGYIYPQNVIIRVKTIRECAKESHLFLVVNTRQFSWKNASKFTSRARSSCSLIRFGNFINFIAISRESYIGGEAFIA